MRIKTVAIKGFRHISSSIQVELSDLLVLVGKNDVGKSTVLEALDIFFNDGKGSVKLDKDDINKKNLAVGDDCIEISVEFEDLPGSIVIDATNETTLAEEEFRFEAGNASSCKKITLKAGKEKVYIKANI